MRHKDIFKTYVWLLDTIRSAGKISLEEINRRWTRNPLSEDKPFARTTFNRYRFDIEEMFGIYIDCDRKDGYRYFISDGEQLERADVQHWIVSTLALNNIMAESRSIHSRIYPEQIPSEGSMLRRIIDAMKRDRVIEVRYRKYGADESSARVVEPYCVKLYMRRWYLLCRYVESGDMRVLAVDRITDIKLTDRTFKLNKDFTATRFFRDYFGVSIGYDTKPERVVIRAYGKEPYYLKDLPLHASQHVLETTPDYTDFELNLHITDDFISDLLGRGATIEVLTPGHLADTLCSRARAILSRYSSVNDTPE